MLEEFLNGCVNQYKHWTVMKTRLIEVWSEFFKCSNHYTLQKRVFQNGSSISSLEGWSTGECLGAIHLATCCLLACLLFLFWNNSTLQECCNISTKNSKVGFHSNPLHGFTNCFIIISILKDRYRGKFFLNYLRIK